MSAPNTDQSMGAYWRAQDEAAEGSRKLADAMQEQFFIFAARHGVTLKDAELICHNPIKLRSRSKRR